MTDVLVLPPREGARNRAARTLRALRARGLCPVDASSWTAHELSAFLAGGSRPVWLVRAGAFPASEGVVAFPPRSATGRGLCGLGAARPHVASGDADAVGLWRDALRQTGGDFTATAARSLPPLSSVYCDEQARPLLAKSLAENANIETAVPKLDARVVRYAPLDVHEDPRLRVVLAVTSLQQGGAERVVLDLFEELGARGVSAVVATLGRPTRTSFAAPSGTLDLSRASDRVSALADAASSLGVDLIHAHLLRGDEMERLASTEIPLVATIHNARPGWPEKLEATRGAALLVACACAVESDLAETRIPVVSRTVWNGIDASQLAQTEALRAEGALFRRTHGLSPRDLVLLAVANPRPQKRLELLPAVLVAAEAELKRRGVDRSVCLVLAGDADPTTESAARSADALRRAIAERGIGARVHHVGSLDRIAPALAAADALVSVSAYEGLSLAHLEALAAGLPVVATDGGGTRELADDNAAISVVPSDTPPEDIARAAIELALRRPAGGRAVVLRDFTREQMAGRYAWLYERAVAAKGRLSRRGLLLVTNNFSTGGAQSSARRLLRGLAAQGVSTRAAVLEEQALFPTSGREALQAAGIPVLALPLNAKEAVRELLEAIDRDPPEAVLLWNALAEHKVLLADALLDIPVFDVSPGEMLYTSFDRWLGRPTPGLPYRSARSYGARLAGVIVKYEREAERAQEVFGAPVHVVSNGVELGRKPAARIPRAPLVIGTAARLSPQKKLEQLFDALRLAAPRLPPHVLRIAGGPERGSEAYAEGLREIADGLDVEWMGDVQDLRPVLDDLDVFAMISEPAGCPNASLEAMAAGVPVVATDVGGSSEQIVDGMTGRLVPRGDVRALGDALVDACVDAEKRRAWGVAGRVRAEQRFDAQRMVADYRRICLSG